MAPYQVVASILCFVFLALALIHFYWAAGGRVALAGAVPSDGDQQLFSPGTLATVAVGCALTVAAATAALRGKLVFASLPGWLPVLGTWTLALVFAARAIGDFRYFGFFKHVRGTLFARRDSQIYSPLCAAISLMAAALNLLAS